MSTATKHPELRRREAQVLAMIQGHLHVYGIPPSQSEIGRALGVTRWAAGAHCRKLVAKGYLRRLSPGNIFYVPVDWGRAPLGDR